MKRNFIVSLFGSLVGVGMLFILLSATGFVRSVHAATLTVTNTNDSGAGSLREALVTAAAGDTIKFSGLPANSIIVLTSGELTVTQEITIDGSTATNLAVDGNNASRVFSVTAPLSIISLTIQHGRVTGDGGGLYTTSALTLTNVSFLTNTATSGGGGGVFFNSPANVTATTFTGNTASNQGGGAEFGGPANVMATTFTSNTATSGSGGAVFFGTANVTATTFTGNTATYGGGASFFGTANVTATTFTGNTAINGGGGAFFYDTANVSATTFTGNTATGNGGGLLAWNAFASTGIQFIHNTAAQGGGLYHTNSGDGQLVNALFARNVASSTLGAALYLDSPGSVQILHTTIASPTVSSDSAIYIDKGTVGITDTIVASHSIGISRIAGTVYANYNLFFGTPISKTGSFIAGSGANDVTGDPKFVNPGVDNYHLQSGSAAIDVGANAGVFTDFDGQPRPMGAGFDIGYDEYAIIYRIYLPLVLKNF